MKWTKETALSYIKENFGKEDFPTYYAKRVIAKLFGSWQKGLILAGVRTIYTHCQLAGCLNPSRSSVCPWCEMHYYRNRRHGDPTIKLTMQYKVNEDCFEKWTTENSWLLGLFWSDGWSQKKGNELGICNKDYNLLQKAQKILGGENLIHEQLNPCLHYKLRFNSEKLANYLKDIGLIPAKSLVADWPKGLPLNLRWSFLRGVFDGDGSISLNKYRNGQKARDARIFWCTGSDLFARKIELNLNELGIKTYVQKYEAGKNKRLTDFFAVLVCSIDSLRKVFENMYDSSDCRLEYKYEKFKSWYFESRYKPGTESTILKFDKEELYRTIVDYWRVNGKAPSLNSGKVFYNGTNTSWHKIGVMLRANRGLRWHTRCAVGKNIGISFDKNRQKWIASISRNYKTIYLGRFSTEQEAIKAREQALEDFQAIDQG